MAELISVNDDDVQCTSCDTVFTLVWQRNLIYDRVEFCPFCGDDIFKVNNELDD